MIRVEYVMVKINLFRRLKKALSTPEQFAPRLEELQLTNKDLLNRVEKLRATVDGEEGWFLCLTKNGKTCAVEEDLK
jgi:hypothetical protein